MRSSLTSSVFLLVLGCCVRFSEAICVECLEFDGHLSWCRWFSGPITETETEGQLGAQLNPPMTWPINSSVFSTVSSDTLQDTVITCATSTLSTPQTSELCTCRVCGKRLKNSLGVRIHMGRMHKDKAALPPPSTDTTTNTQTVAVEGLQTTTATTTSTPTSTPALISNKVPTEDRKIKSTSKSTRTAIISNTTNEVAAIDRLSTTKLDPFQQSSIHLLQGPQVQQSRSMVDNTSSPTRIIHSTNGRVSVMRAAKNQPIQPINSNTLKCICGKDVKGYRGYRLHARVCAVSKRLLIAPVPAQGTSAGPTTSQSNNQDHTTIHAETCLTADLNLSDLNSNNKLNSNVNSMTNNVTATNDNISFTPIVPNVSPDGDLGDNRGSLSHDRFGASIAVTSDHPSPSASKPLRPLPGVPLPRTEGAWMEMNRFFHSAPIFRFATGTIGDIDLAAAEFNQAIYGYLKDKYGTLRGDKVTTQGDAALNAKYQGFSRSKVRRELSKLKRRGPIIQGSPLCDEILYLSHRLRSDITNRPQTSKSVTDRDFGIGFWPACKKNFADVVGATPTFTILKCGEYFSRVLAIPGSIGSCLFKIPNWFISLPAPATPFDQSPPSYAEIASIIKKARAGSSACPLDQISVITLKKCPILRSILHNIIAGCWQSQYTPKAWRVGVTILIYKKGDPSSVDNFRPITLQSVPCKIFSSFIRNRLQAFLDNNNYHNNNIQKGFAHGHDGVLEHTELLDFMMRDAKKSHRGYFAVLLDLRNAFGEVHHDLIRSSLRYHHVPETFIQIFNSIYSDFGVTVSSRGQLTDMILVRRGVLQGDPCSPLLFNLCFNSLMRLLESPSYRQMGYFWDKHQRQQCSWLQYADDALIMANRLSTAQGLVRLFEAWCEWAKMDIRLDKCLTFGAVMLDRKFQQILPKINLRDNGMIPAVPMGGHFKYLGKILDFQSLNAVPKKEFESKLVKILGKISSLRVRSQTKLKIFSMYVPSQFNFELKIYNFTDAFMAGVIDRLCTSHIREWLEFPPSSCVTKWASSPTGFCGLGIPTFAHRAARMSLTRRHLLQSSKNPSIRRLWEASKGPNILVDSLLENRDLKKASTILRDTQAKESLDHFLGLKSQGVMAKVVNETVLQKHVQLWKQSVDSLPEHVFNFARKVMMSQLPTLHNLKLWNCSSTNLCPKCGVDQTNKHVLSNCSSPDALARYTYRHNRILELIARWIVPQLE